jgi:hypothetical protein
VFGPRSPGQQPRYEAPWCATAISVEGSASEGKPSCDVFTPGTGPRGRPGVATGADCLAWAGDSTAVVACDSRLLAADLATEEDLEEDSISVTVRGRAGAVRAEPSETAGVTQLVDKPVAAPATVILSGAVSDAIVRARQPLGRRPKDEVELRFFDLGLEPGDSARVRLRYVEGRVRAVLVTELGEVVQPSEAVRTP